MTTSTSVGRRRLLARRALLSLTTVLCSGLAAPAFCQVTSVPYRNLDANGVDLTLGDFLMSFPEGTIGSGQAALSLIRQSNGYYPSQWDGYGFHTSTAGTTTTVTVSKAGQYADTFTRISGTTTFTTVKQNGATLTGSDDSYVYQAADGTKITFTNAWGNDGIATNICGTGGVGTNCSLQATSITSPDGRTVNISYSFRGTTPNYMIWRIGSIANNFGYSIGFAYQATLPAKPVTQWQTRISAGFYNSASTTPLQATVSYAYPAADTTDITDPAGNVWEITSTSIKRPGETSPSFTIGGSASAVTSVTADGVTTTYARTVSGTTGTMVVTDGAGNPTTIVSDLSIGQPTQVTNALSKTVSYGHDSYGRLTSVTQPEGNYVQYTLDGRGNATQTQYFGKVLPFAALTYTAAYDATCGNALTCNQPNSVTTPLGNTTSYTYDGASGQVTKVTLPAPTTGATAPETRYSYTATGGIYFLTGISQCQTGTAPGCVGTADEVKTTITDDAQGNITSVSKAAGNGSLAATTTATYSAMGDLLTIDGPLSGTADTSTYRYDAARRQVGMIAPDPDGSGSLKQRALRTTYDTAGRPTEVELGTVTGTTDAAWAAFATAQQQTTTYTSNRATNIALTSGGTAYSVTQYSYDSDGRQLCVATRMNSAAWGSYTDACTLQAAGAAGQDRISRTDYDAAGRANKATSAYATTMASVDATATFTDNGQTATLADANGNLTTYGYDRFDRFSKTQYPSPTTTGTSSTTDYDELVYDSDNRVTSRHLRGYAADSTQHIDYSYDNDGRVTLKNLPGSELDVTYGYDLLSQPTSAATSVQTLSFTYDALGRNLTQVGPLGTVTSQYDIADRRTRLTWPDTFYVTYDYDVTGNMTKIHENGATTGIGVLATFGYDDLGRRTTLTRGNGTITTYTPDAVSRLSTLTLNLAGTASDLNLGFAYNPASQIANTTRSNDTYAWTGATNVNRAYTVNGLNQYTAAGGTAFSYDNRGNLTGSGGSAFGYSSENLLTSGPSSAVLAYDPMLRLYQESGTGVTLTSFLYDGVDMLGEYQSGAFTKRYVHGDQADEPLVEYNGSGTRTWLHADERGSIIARSDDTGTTTAINGYDEYGIPTSSNVGRFGYTGQTWLPSLGDWNYKARIYSPTLGRFMQMDPIGYGAGMNWYNYVGSDPVNYLDILGMEQRCITLVVKRGDGVVENPDGSLPRDPHVSKTEETTCWEVNTVSSGKPKPKLQPLPCAYMNASGTMCVYTRDKNGKLQNTPEFQKKVCENNSKLQDGSAKANDGLTATAVALGVRGGLLGTITGGLATFGAVISSVTTGSGFRPFGLTIIPKSAPPEGCN